MTTQAYDGIATDYQESKLLPFRRYIEEHTIFSLLPSLDGTRVLDVACGEGIYARKLRDRGAASVTAVDISTAMIALAEEEERKRPLGIHYLAMDAAAVSGLGEFDFVFGAYLLNYAKSAAELRSFAASIFRNLKPGGRFVGFNDNPANDPADFSRYRKYGFIKSRTAALGEGRVEGEPITYTLYNQEGEAFSFDNYYVSPATYVDVFREVGFTSFSWIRPVVSDVGVQAFEPGYWDDYLGHLPMMAIVAIK